MNGALKEIQETATLIEDGSLIFLLCQLIVDVLKLNGLGVITVSDTADAAITQKPFSFRTSTISWLSRRTKLPFLRNGAASRCV